MTLSKRNPAAGCGARNAVCLAANSPENSRIGRSIQEQSRLRGIEFEAVNRAALAVLPAVLARLIPGGKIVAREYAALNPTRADRHVGSFKINLRSGHWADFATGEKGGDPVSLVAYVEGVSQSEAARRLARMLGLDTREGGRHG